MRLSHPPSQHHDLHLPPSLDTAKYQIQLILYQIETDPCSIKSIFGTIPGSFWKRLIGNFKVEKSRLLLMGGKWGKLGLTKVHLNFQSRKSHGT